MTTNTGAPTQLGHLALRVRDLDKSIEFYTDVLGLKLRMKTRGPAFLGIREDASHELALMPIAADAEGPDPNRAGLYHFAWEMGSFEALEALHSRLIAKGAKIAGYSPATDSANVMFFDPDGNEIEAIWEPTKAEVERIKAAGEMPKLEHAI